MRAPSPAYVAVHPCVLALRSLAAPASSAELGGDGCAPAHSGHTFPQGYMISRDSCHTRSCDMPDSSLSGYSGPGPHGQGKALSHITVIHVLRLLLPPTYLSDTACWLFFAHFPTRELVAM